MRRMSFAITTDAVRARTKTVTRRLGWRFAEPGDRLLAVDKLRTKAAQKLGVIEIVDARIEELEELLSLRESDRYTEAEAAEEVRREGFTVSPAQFVRMFRESLGFRPPGNVIVTRIEFRYVEVEP